MATLLPNLDNPCPQQSGQPPERVTNKVKGALPESVKDFMRQSSFLAMATSNRAGRCDTSPEGGMLGFVQTLDDRRLLIPALRA
jgi:hypothetical protein